MTTEQGDSPYILAIGIGALDQSALCRIQTISLGNIRVASVTDEKIPEATRSLIAKADLLFIIADLDCVAESNLVPMIGGMARQRGSLSIGIVVASTAKKPGESERRTKRLAEFVDALILIPCQPIATPQETENCVDAIVKTIADIHGAITNIGMVNLDFSDLKIILTNAGIVKMGIACASGVDRAERATLCVLEKLKQAGLKSHTARRVLIYVESTDSLTLSEVCTVLDFFDHLSPQQLVLIASATNNQMGERLCLTMFATE